jgi:hypothetical protein
MLAFLLFVCGKTSFLYRDKDCLLTYQKLTGFMVSFTYLEFLGTRLSLNLSLFSISLVLRYMVIWVKVLSNLIFGFLGCYLLRQGLLNHVIKRSVSTGSCQWWLNNRLDLCFIPAHVAGLGPAWLSWVQPTH